MISHDLSVLATACERIAIMRYGEVIEVGDAREVCLNPKEEYSQKLAAAFPVIGDPESRMRPVTRHDEQPEEAESNIDFADGGARARGAAGG